MDGWARKEMRKETCISLYLSVSVCVRNDGGGGGNARYNKRPWHVIRAVREAFCYGCTLMLLLVFQICGQDAGDLCQHHHQPNLRFHHTDVSTALDPHLGVIRLNETEALSLGALVCTPPPKDVLFYSLAKGQFTCSFSNVGVIFLSNCRRINSFRQIFIRINSFRQIFIQLQKD